MTSSENTPSLSATVLSTMFAQSVCAVVVFGAGVLAPEVAAEAGVPATRIGLFNAIVYLAAMFAGAFTGFAVARFGAVSAMLMVLIILIVGLLLTMTGHWIVIAISGIALGIPYGLMNPAGSHVLMEVSPVKWRAFIFSLKQTGVTLGGALAGLMLPPIILLYGWRAALFAQILLILLAMGCLLPFRKVFDRPNKQALSSRSWREPLNYLLANRAVGSLAVISFLFAGNQISVGAFFVLFAHQHLNVDLISAGFLFSIMQIGGVAGRLFWGFIASRVVSAMASLAMIAVVTAIMLLFLIQLDSTWPFAAVSTIAFVLGSGTFGWNGVMLAEIARLAPPDRVSDATGAAQFVFFGGVVCMPPMFGFLVERSQSFTPAFAMLCVICILAAVLVLLHAWLNRKGVIPTS